MFIRNLNLLFADFDSESGGGDQGAEVDAPETGGGNPAWEDIRSLVDPETFTRIEPKLQDWDKGVQQRFTTISEKYKPYEDILEGRQPDWLKQAVALAEHLDQNPADMYERLGQYLQQMGMTPAQAQQVAQQAVEENQEQDGEVDPRISQLEQQQKLISDQLRQQHEEGIRRQAEAQLDSEIRQLREKHKDLTDDDITEIIQRAALAAQRSQGKPGARVPTLEEAFQEYQALQNRILTRQRPGDSAPNLVPPGGGAGSASQTKPWGKLSKGEMEDAVAALLQNNQAGS